MMTQPILKYMCPSKKTAGIKCGDSSGWIGRAVVAVLLVAALGAGARGQRVKVWVSSGGGDRMAAKEDREFGKGKDDGAAKADFSINKISINKQVKYQRMEGFGASIMEAGLMKR